MKALFIPCLICGLIFGCNKDETEPEHKGLPVHGAHPPGMFNPIVINFIHKTGDLPLEFGKACAAPNGDTFYVSKFRYYISNIQLIKDNDSTYGTIDCPVIDASAGTSYTVITDPGPLKFKGMSFMIGIDSTRIVSGPALGLNPYSWNEMYRGKDSGYFFMKLEGEVQKGSVKKPLTYNIGGFGGPYKTQRTFLIEFNGTAETGLNKKPVVNLITDLSEIFKTPHLIEVFNQSSLVTTGSGAKMVADNYADMVSFHSIDQ
jgi:hypothetical protein